MALVDHASGTPFALLHFDDERVEQVTTHDLLERRDIRSKAITLYALHTTRKTVTLITERCSVDCFPTGTVPGSTMRPRPWQIEEA